jgi:TonB family protein
MHRFIEPYTPGAGRNRDSSRIIGLLSAIAITGALFFMVSLAGWMGVGSIQRDAQVVQISLLDAYQLSGQKPNFLRPKIPDVPVPTVEIARSDPSEETKPKASVNAQTLPARSDPASPNDEPKIPAGFGGATQLGPIIVIADVLVLEDGSIGDAKLVGTSGLSELDDAALSFIKRYWRFLPAVKDGKATKDRITVEVLFRRG